MMQANLFISSFKRHKKSLWTVISIIGFLFCLYLSHRVLWFLLVDDTGANYYTRITMHEFYNQEENIDVLFLGSSHCYRSLNPIITDYMFNANTFNVGSGNQRYDASYALLVEAGKESNLQKVYVDIFYLLAGQDYNERTSIDLTSAYIISDYMKPTFNRLVFLLNASNSEQWINSFFPELRERNNILDFQYIASIISKKNSNNYRNYEYIELSDRYYVRKGHVAYTNEILNGNFSQNGHFSSAAVIFSEDDIRFLENIISYCHNHNIELVFFSTPMSDFRLRDAGDYDLYISYVKDFLSGYNIPYYDFNLCKEEFFSYDSNLFADDNHLNETGSKLFSILFSDFFNGQIEEDDLFYSSYEEKMNSIDNNFYGLIYEREEAENSIIYTFTPVQNRVFPYYVSVFKQDSASDETEEMQILSPLDTITLSENEHGQLLIYIYSDELGENMTNEIIINY